MIIALINWRVQPAQVGAFLDKWKTGLKLEGARGLVAEFLSRVEDDSFHEGVTWTIEPDDQDDRTTWVSQSYVSYVNVGIWETVDDFMNAVGKYMTKGRVIKEVFEAAPRRRAILTPEHWRIGVSRLPSATSPGVLE
ncbi:hypothetical protein P6U16_00600 [Rhizobium sp. 32-5/1]|uniref:hypothetical protein n=1 Tax=Rhizobium sp. 32-5/1 TaxID=3019602 RepID=UPI00240D279F|nr:hypothetical protein [Rhizobium sp. 32-5/1]WEZ83429.1 hypothetical protein P6U16_00600 [Rhizobium sp. 32-5/1]